ncbi:SLC13 family permease [Thermomonas brevis]
MLLLLWERWPPDRILLGAVAVLMGTGILTPMQALAGFWNPGVLTVGLLFVLVAALKTTGAIAALARWLLGGTRRLQPALWRVAGSAGVASAFVNNTPIVATLTSALEQWSRRSGVPVGKLLLPMNYATILGGMCTMIGTSTNLVVGGLAVQAGLPRMDLFAPLMIGLPALGVGLLFLGVVGHRLLPVRRSPIAQAQIDAREYAVEMLLHADGPLVGRGIGEAGMRRLQASYLVELQRDGVLLPAVGPAIRLRAGDRLVFVGATDGVRELRAIEGLTHAADHLFSMAPGDQRRPMVELVLSSFSPAVGKTLRESHFREIYGAAVLAISRGGRRLPGKLGDVVLQAGDTLLAETEPGFRAAHGNSPDFLLVIDLDGHDVPVARGRAAFTLLALLGMVLSNALLGVDMLWSALAAAVAVLASGSVRLEELRRSADVRLLVVIASSFALGAAAQQTGLAAAAGGVMGGLSGADPFWTLVVIYVATVLFTELLTNNAAAVLMFPVALSAAAQVGSEPMPYVMAIMMAASAGFMTPIGYQTNLMVYGPGGYRFTDYLRVGAPLSLLVGLTVIWTIARTWSL